MDDAEATIPSESIDYWLEQCMPASKLIKSLPSYGRCFTLADETQTSLLAPAIGPGTMGRYTGQDGFISFYDMCFNQQKGWTVATDPTSNKMGPYGYKVNHWVGWDNIAISVTKVKFAMSKGLGSIILWGISLDYFNGVCALWDQSNRNWIDFEIELIISHKRQSLRH